MSDMNALLSSASSSLSAGTGAPSVGSNLSTASAQKTGQDFEAYFLSQAFENMFSGIEADPMFGGGQSEGIYRSMMVQEYSKVAARSHSTGISDEVTREILRMQERQQH
jgi:Rod binding domain-containing protein